MLIKLTLNKLFLRKKGERNCSPWRHEIHSGHFKPATRNSVREIPILLGKNCVKPSSSL